jgi:hypothetical protein
MKSYDELKAKMEAIQQQTYDVSCDNDKLVELLIILGAVPIKISCTYKRRVSKCLP